MKHVFTFCLFKQRKVNTQNKKQNWCLNSLKSFIYLLGGITANVVNFMQSMLVSSSLRYFSSLKSDIRKVSKILTSEN